MSRMRVILATLACVAFLAVSAGPASADGEVYKKCEVYVVGIGCDDGKVHVSIPYDGVKCLEEGDSFWANPWYPVQWKAQVGKYYGPWKYGKVFWREGRCYLDVSRGFCDFTVTGIPGDCLIKLCDGRLVKNNTELCLPAWAYVGYQGVSGDVRGPWHAKTVDCEDWDLSKKFCTFEIKGIPTQNCGGVVDIKGIAEKLVNGDEFCVPKGVVIYYRARLEEIAGPWCGRQVDWDCCGGYLDVAGKWVQVVYKYDWSTDTQLYTTFKGFSGRVVNRGYWCFPKYAKVCALPASVPNFSNYCCKEFYCDSIVCWKVYCAVSALKVE